VAAENHGLRVVLMADDDEEDCFLAKEAFEASGTSVIFRCLQDGVEVMDYLLDPSFSEACKLPDLILLDLNMPSKDGLKALLEIKADSSLEHIPIVILTTSEEEKDYASCMEAGADSYFTKPASFGEWVAIMKSLAKRWLVA